MHAEEFLLPLRIHDNPHRAGVVRFCATMWIPTIQKRGCPEKEICDSVPEKRGWKITHAYHVVMVGTIVTVSCKNAIRVWSGWTVYGSRSEFSFRPVSLTTTAAAVASEIGHVLHKLLVVYDSNSNFQSTLGNRFCSLFFVYQIIAIPLVTYRWEKAYWVQRIKLFNRHLL